MNSHDQSEEIAEATIAVDNEKVKRWIAIRRNYLRKRRVARFFELNPIAWFFDEFPPQEMYRNLHARRNTRQELRHHWMRQRTGWTYLSHLKSSAGIRFAAAAGVVSAAFQAAPGLHGVSKDTPFKWLLAAGLCYLTAVFWYEIFSPLLLKQVLGSTTTRLGSHGRRWMRALVEDELRRWWKKREWIPHPGLVDPESMEDHTALVIIGSYGVPAFSGFDVYACAHIELALAEFGRTEKTRLWRASERHGEALVEFLPFYSLEGSRPLIRRLSIRRPNWMEMEADATVSAQDLVIAWWDANIEISHLVPGKFKTQIDGYAEGVVHLFDTDEHAIAFARTIAYWQDTLHPWRRIVLLGLYFASAAFFLLFVVAQMSATFSFRWQL